MMRGKNIFKDWCQNRFSVKDHLYIGWKIELQFVRFAEQIYH